MMWVLRGITSGDPQEGQGLETPRGWVPRPTVGLFVAPSRYGWIWQRR